MDPLCNTLDDNFLRICKSCFRLESSQVEKKAKLSRSKALERFILAPSDQQIVAGLVIFITEYNVRCTISSYHFFIITALGWFSFTTHLSTLTLLKPHFRHSPIQKFVRLLAIITTFIMLFLGLLVVYTTLPFGVPARCRLAHISLQGTKPLNYVVAVFLFSILTITFVSKAVKFGLTGSGGLSEMGATWLRRWSLNGSTVISRARYCSNRLEQLPRSSSSCFLSNVRGNYIIFVFIYIEFLNSFLWEITSLLFWNFYGLRQLLWARIFVGNNKGVIKIGDEEDRLNFGQLLTLLLLALPVLSAVEAFYGMKDLTQVINIFTQLLTICTSQTRKTKSNKMRNSKSWNADYPRLAMTTPLRSRRHQSLSMRTGETEKAKNWDPCLLVPQINCPHQI